jgi:predicted NAD/FAD-dependent oxidoreductase
MKQTETTDVIMIGAGISGLMCATELQKAGLLVQLIDKGRGFGGRMATRRMAGGRLDHGAQYFTVRDPLLQDYVDQWLEAGVIKEWFRHLPEDHNPAGYPRYCGINGMTDVPKYLAKNLQVHRSEHACKLTRKKKGWKVKTLSGNRYFGRHLVITAPLPQALALLDASRITLPEPIDEAFRQIQYEKGLTTMAILDGPSGLPEPGGLKIDDGVLSWLADNRMKGISPAVSAVTIHANGMFAAQHWGSPNAIRGQKMLEAAAPYLASKVLEYNCHRWGFAIAQKVWSERFFMEEDLQLTLAGDSFGGPRIEGAALSGLAAAKQIGER